MRRWRLPVLLLAATPLLAAGPSAPSAQHVPWVGRWVNTDAADQGMFILAVTPDGRFHRLMPAPGFAATYRPAGSRLVMRMGDGSVDSTLTLVHGDTIMQGSRAFLARLPGAAVGNAGVRGTWSAISAAPLEMFMTFRSDGVAVLEVGFPVEASVHGDTVRLTSSQTPAAVFVVQQAGDTLHVRDTAGKDRRFVRRPWGCLGLGAFDASAPECR